MDVQHLEDFCNALGLFIYNFSEIERLLFVYLIVTARIPISDAQAIFTEARIDKVKQTVKRLRQARNLPEDDRLDLAFSHLADLTRLRNDLVHYGPTPQANGTFQVSDELWKLANPTTYFVAADDLRNAASDLTALKEFFMKHILTETIPTMPLIKNMPQVALLPWRYKPSQPIRRQSNTQSKSARPPSQPVSSGE